MFILFLILIIMPIIEMWLLISIGSQIGAGTTILMVIFTGVTGAWLAKKEGLRALTSIQKQLNQGVMPAQEMIAGLLIFAGGILLLTPGFITDAIGFSFIFPGTRTLWLSFFGDYFAKKIASGQIHIQTQAGFNQQKQADNKMDDNSDVIDVEYREVNSTDSDQE
jgi:UPF0716 protein FxsA